MPSPRLIGYVWGFVGGAGCLLAITQHPLWLLLPLVTFFANYHFRDVT